MLALGLLAITTFSCSRAPSPGSVPPPQDLPALGLGEGAGTLAWRGLDALASARIVLPAPGSAAAVGGVPGELTGTFPLAGPWTDSGRVVGRLHVFQHPLPFLTDMPRPNYAPMGARLYRAEAEIPFVNEPEDLRGGGWFIEDNTVLLLSLEHPERWTTPPRLKVAELAAETAKRRWSGVGSAAEFVHTEVTVGGITRTGVQLPPGAEITFPIDLPAEPMLGFGLVALPPLLPGHQAGGATVSWSIDGEELGSASVSAGGAPQDQQITLGKWAGKRVELTWRAATDGAANAVVTAPTLTTRTGRTPRHVVVVGIDTLRQDALGLYGYGRDTSPELDAWAAQAVVFDAAWAPAPRTRPSFRTALTGRYPLAAASAPTVAEAFAAQGFRTAGVVANVHLVPRFGFTSGFEDWHYENGAKAEVEIERALTWQRAHAEEDTFLFLHLMDPHTFYDAPSPYGARFQTGARPARLPDAFERWQVYRLLEAPWFADDHKRWIRAAYDGEVAYTSAVLGRFFTELDALPGRTVTAVHSDHGEEFFEHGGFEHNHTLYEELVRVALWIRAPGGQSGGTRVRAPVGLIDLVPTLLDLVGLPPVESDGRSLAAYVDPTRAAERDTLTAELTARPLMLGHLMFGKERWAVVSQGWKYILHTGSGQEEVYDLEADRGEQADLAATVAPERLHDLRRAMAEASGWAVRPGWRLRVEGPRRPIELRFDAPIAAAGIIDPEAERSSRANLEWGELAAVSIADVGRIVVSPDKLSVRFLPGPRAAGHQLYVSCEEACPPGTILAGSGNSPLVEGSLAIGDLRFEAAAGTLLDVPSVEEQLAAPGSAQIQALQSLGYIDPD
ncbi:MAG: sulfatase [Pseudomonadota bacterium]|nr:sulfatase [Pseudomonadota bacterium]